MKATQLSKKSVYVRNADRIEHFTIRRELPVLNLPIEVVYEDEDLIAVNKPPSMPVHPCGAYNKNSLINILRLDKKFEDVHRSLRL